MQSKHQKFNTTATPLFQGPSSCYFIRSKSTNIADVIICAQIKKLPKLDFTPLPSPEQMGKTIPKKLICNISVETLSNLTWSSPSV